MLARLTALPLLPVVMLSSFLSVVISVLFLVGMPMAGTESAIIATVVAGAMTLLLALAFSHGGHGEAGH
jgi:uncharacterized membrane protein